MNEFLIKWPNGSEETCCTEQSRDDFINERWGSMFAAFEERGGKLTALHGEKKAPAKKAAPKSIKEHTAEEKMLQEQKEADEKAAAEKAAEEKAFAEKVTAENKAAAEKEAADKALAEEAARREKVQKIPGKQVDLDLSDPHVKK